MLDGGDGGDDDDEQGEEETKGEEEDIVAEIWGYAPGRGTANNEKYMIRYLYHVCPGILCVPPMVVLASIFGYC